MLKDYKKKKKNEAKCRYVRTLILLVELFISVDVITSILCFSKHFILFINLFTNYYFKLFENRSFADLFLINLLQNDVTTDLLDLVEMD